MTVPASTADTRRTDRPTVVPLSVTTSADSAVSRNISSSGSRTFRWALSEPALLMLIGVGLLAAGLGARRLQGRGLLIRLEVAVRGAERVALRQAEEAAFARWADYRRLLEAAAASESGASSGDAEASGVAPVPRTDVGETSVQKRAPDDRA